MEKGDFFIPVPKTAQRAFLTLHFRMGFERMAPADAKTYMWNDPEERAWIKQSYDAGCFTKQTRLFIESLLKQDGEG